MNLSTILMNFLIYFSTFIIYLYQYIVDLFIILVYYYYRKECLYMIYTDNEQLVTELKKLLLDTKNSQRDIAKKMGISPQAFQNLLNKKQLSFADLKRILDCMNCNLIVDFSLRSSLEQANISDDTSTKTVNLDDTKQEKSPNKANIDLSDIDLYRLENDTLYQIDMAQTYGMNVLSELLEKARQQSNTDTEE